ncbi:MAG: hypothetical protein Q8N07_00205 [Rhodocyclaceae bacterium]|nr:hypothetical protein [Rhodocyclaceae bacterium]
MHTQRYGDVTASALGRHGVRGGNHDACNDNQIFLRIIDSNQIKSNILMAKKDLMKVGAGGTALTRILRRCAGSYKLADLPR